MRSSQLHLGTVSAVSINPFQVILVNNPLPIFTSSLIQLININSFKNILILRQSDSSVCVGVIKKRTIALFFSSQPYCLI